MEQDVLISLPGLKLRGIFSLSKDAKGIVIFAHGSGSGRHSPRNQFVARYLNQHNIGTLLLDLLTEAEELIDDQTRELRFNIPLLSDRLALTTDWVLKQSNLPIGYFGASTGAAAALIAAAKKKIAAVVSRGGRPDLAGAYLKQVRAPTLLIVGGDDPIVIELNQQAYDQLICQKELKIVPGATHLFEEPGCLEQVAKWAADWFVQYLGKSHV